MDDLYQIILVSRILSSNKNEARKIKIRLPIFPSLMTYYTRRSTLSLTIDAFLKKGEYKSCKIYEGQCGDHSGGVKLAKKC